MKSWNKWIILLWTTATFSSCASHDLQEISDIKLEKDLVESFSLEDGRFEQYKNNDAVAEKTATPAETPASFGVGPAPAAEKQSALENRSAAPVPPKGAAQLARPKKKEKVAAPPVAAHDKTVRPSTMASGPIISKKMNYYQIRQGLKPNHPADYPEDFTEFDKKYYALWSRYRPTGMVGEEFTLHISYLGLSAGDAVLKILPLAKFGTIDAFHFMVRLVSAKYFEGIYKLDDIIESFVAKDEVLPIKYSLVQRESKQNVDDLQLFDHQENKTFYYYRREKKGKNKQEQHDQYVPVYFQDSFSGLLFVRGLPLKVGDYYEFPIATRSKIWITKVWVDQEETISVLDQDIPALRLRAETHYPGVLEKKGDILFWFSKDERHLLLKFAAKVKIGSVKGVLTKYTPGQMPLSAY